MPSQNAVAVVLDRDRVVAQELKARLGAYAGDGRLTRPVRPRDQNSPTVAPDQRGVNRPRAGAAEPVHDQRLPRACPVPWGKPRLRADPAHRPLLEPTMTKHELGPAVPRIALVGGGCEPLTARAVALARLIAGGRRRRGATRLTTVPQVEGHLRRLS